MIDNHQEYPEILMVTNPLMYHFEKKKENFFKKHLKEEQEQLKIINERESIE
jgi:hypothetical protein